MSGAPFPQKSPGGGEEPFQTRSKISHCASPDNYNSYNFSFSIENYNYKKYFFVGVCCVGCMWVCVGVGCVCGWVVCVGWVVRVWVGCVCVCVGGHGENYNDNYHYNYNYNNDYI